MIVLQALIGIAVIVLLYYVGRKLSTSRHRLRLQARIHRLKQEEITLSEEVISLFDLKELPAARLRQLSKHLARKPGKRYSAMYDKVNLEHPGHYKLPVDVAIGCWIALAAASGVIGNVTYDAVKRVFQKPSETTTDDRSPGDEHYNVLEITAILAAKLKLKELGISGDLRLEVREAERTDYGTWIFVLYSNARTLGSWLIAVVIIPADLEKSDQIFVIIDIVKYKKLWGYH